MRTLIIAFLMMSMSSLTLAEALPGWNQNDPSSQRVLDHSTWQTFLDQYLDTDDYGQTYFAYAKVSRTERNQLTGYIRQLESIDPLTLNENEQKAYWFNLYNAVTVKVILDHYPVESIRDIGGSFGGLVKSGPWKLKLTTINGKPLSLDDIEHGIVRPIFKDYRVHFAFNCASMGCPNLAATAYSGDNIEGLLQEAERSFINHQRGVRFQGGRLIVSKIFDWYLQDFVADEDQLTDFLAQSAEPRLRAQLKSHTGRIKYEYDWALNEVKE